MQRSWRMARRRNWANLARVRTTTHDMTEHSTKTTPVSAAQSDVQSQIPIGFTS